MDIFGWLRRERQQETFTPEQLRGKLFDAIAAHDDRKLTELCERHAAVIVEHYRHWQSLPCEFDKPGKREWYGDGMVALAKHFRDRRGAPELWQWLEAPMLIDQWRQTIDEAPVVRRAARRSHRAAARGGVVPGPVHLPAL